MAAAAPTSTWASSPVRTCPRATFSSGAPTASPLKAAFAPLSRWRASPDFSRSHAPSTAHRTPASPQSPCQLTGQLSLLSNPLLFPPQSFRTRASLGTAVTSGDSSSSTRSRRGCSLSPFASLSPPYHPSRNPHARNHSDAVPAAQRKLFPASPSHARKRIKLGSEDATQSMEDTATCSTGPAGVVAPSASSPGLPLARRGFLSLGAAVLGAAAAEASGLNHAMAATAGLLAPSSPPGAPAEAKPLLPGVAERAKDSRVYDASVLGEPMALSSKGRAWQKMLSARVVYLGEAEGVHDPADKVLELEIIQHLRDECFRQQRPVTVAFSAFPRTLQPDLDAYFGKKLSEEGLRARVSHWAPGRWEETLPILRYCQQAGVRLYAAGVPPEVLRTVQAQGIHALSAADRKKYAPSQRASAAAAAATSAPSDNFPGVDGVGAALAPLGALMPWADMAANAEGIFSRTQTPNGRGPYLFAQARVVEEHTMVQAVAQAMSDGSSLGMLVVITGASHVRHGARGRGVPSKVDPKQKKQVVVLLNPQRQVARAEGALPEADFLWYAGSWACTRNCFDRAEVARVMGAAGRRREALPPDLQLGIERGLISPETLQSFFELESQPWIAEATKRFQGLRERFYADPKFLHRLCIEEAISISTSLVAQYNRRGPKFWSEIEYVITDITRGAVVDFFTVWLPAPTLSFDSKAMDPANQLNSLGGPGSGNFLQTLTAWVSKLPDNAFQRPGIGQDWSMVDRLGAAMVGGLKLFSVGFVSSVGTVGANNGLQTLRKALSGAAHVETKEEVKRSPVLKTALVYGAFLGTSANFRYQVIAGAVEHWVADYFLASQPALGAALSFVARTANSYWGTGQWVDLARRFGLQAHADESDDESPKAAVPAQATGAPGAANPPVELTVPLPVPVPVPVVDVSAALALGQGHNEGGPSFGPRKEIPVVPAPQAELRADAQPAADVSADLAALCDRLEHTLALEAPAVPHCRDFESAHDSSRLGEHVAASAEEPVVGTDKLIVNGSSHQWGTEPGHEGAPEGSSSDSIFSMRRGFEGSSSTLLSEEEVSLRAECLSTHFVLRETPEEDLRRLQDDGATLASEFTLEDFSCSPIGLPSMVKPQELPAEVSAEQHHDTVSHPSLEEAVHPPPQPAVILLDSPLLDEVDGSVHLHARPAVVLLDSPMLEDAHGSMHLPSKSAVVLLHSPLLDGEGRSDCGVALADMATLGQKSSASEADGGGDAALSGAGLSAALNLHGLDGHHKTGLIELRAGQPSESVLRTAPENICNEP